MSTIMTVIVVLGLAIFAIGEIAGHMAGGSGTYSTASARVYSRRAAIEAQLISLALVVCLYGDYLIYRLTH